MEEIDRSERSGDKEVSGLFESNSFPDIWSSETESDDLSVYGDEKRSGVLQKPNDYNDEEWEIKSSIGMDSTLDMEEEEDEDDKVAVGDKEYDYTEDVNDYDTEEDEWEKLPASFKEIEKDHLAAKLRVKEDAEAVHKLNSLHVSEVHEDNLSLSTSANEKALLMSEELHVAFADDSGLKPIFKRKEYKLQKRVRVGSDIKDDNLTGGDKDSLMDTISPNEHEEEPVIPDYMQNPSKYTRYTIDSGEIIDEVSNQKAYLDFLNIVRSRDKPMVDPLMELPKSVAFVPKRKPMAESKVDNMDKGYERRNGAIAVDTIEDCTVSAIEEDGHDTALNVIRKPSRPYRIRAKEDEEEI